MTAARQKQKQPVIAILAILIVLAPMLFVAAPSARAGLTERIVVDWHTGLAISGYDPVSFFTDQKPMLGNGKFELRFDGVVWRFRNVGNRAAFAARPDVYMPRYGGYDPVRVARMVAVAGKPNLWVIAGERLYLFYDEVDREKFAADPARWIAAGDRNWPRVIATLDP